MSLTALGEVCMPTSRPERHACERVADWTRLVAPLPFPGDPRLLHGRSSQWGRHIRYCALDLAACAAAG